MTVASGSSRQVHAIGMLNFDQLLPGKRAEHAQMPADLLASRQGLAITPDHEDVALDLQWVGHDDDAGCQLYPVERDDQWVIHAAKHCPCRSAGGRGSREGAGREEARCIELGACDLDQGQAIDVLGGPVGTLRGSGVSLWTRNTAAASRRREST